MVQQLLHAVIHKLDKVAGSPATIREAAGCLDVSEVPLLALVEQVQQVYTGRASKSYGQFDPNLRAASAELHVKRLRDEANPDFFDISKQLMQVLKSQSDSQNFATGGHVLMFDVNSMGDRWFGVVILNSTAGTMIDDSLRVVSAPHLDVDGIRFAGRVNITQWGPDGDRYISFLRGKRNDVSVYFQRFLGCSTTQQDLNDTRNLVKAVKRFASDEQLEPEVRERLLRLVDRLASEKARSQQPLDLEALANEAWPEDPDALRRTFAAAEPPIADGFVPSKKGLEGLTRFTARARNWKLEFDREVIADQTFEFVRDEGTLIIHDLPADIVASLTEEFSQIDLPAQDAPAIQNVEDEAEKIPAD